MNSKFIFSLPVWGEKYIRNFLDISLRSLLSKNNLPYLLEQNYKIEFNIYTKKDELSFFEEDNLLNELKNSISINITHLDDIILGDKYDFMTFAHADTLINKAKIGDYIFFIVADAIYSNSFFKYIDNQFKNNKSVVYMLGFRTTLNLVKECKDNYFEEDGSIDINSKVLTKLAIKHMHIDSKSHFINKKPFTHWNSVLINEYKDGLIMKGFHLHPIAIKCTKYNKQISIGKSVDGGDFDLLRSIKDTVIGYLNDSDEASMYTFEIDDNRSYSVVENREFNIFALADWMKNHSTKNHIKLVKQNFLVNIDNRDLIDEKLSEVDYLIEKAKVIFKKNIFFDNLADIQYRYLEKQNLQKTQLDINCLVSNIENYSKLHSSFSKEQNFQLKQLYCCKEIKTDKEFFRVITLIIEVLNSFGGGKSYFPILDYEIYKKLLEKLKNAPSKIILYGAGAFGLFLYRILNNSLNKKVLLIIDDGLVNRKINNCKVVPLNQVKVNSLTASVIVCSLNKEARTMMENNIEKKDYKIYDIYK